MSPPAFVREDLAHREEFATAVKLRDKLSTAAAAVVVVASVLFVAFTAVSTQPAGCTVGVARFFEIDPSPSPSGTKDVKVIGGVRQAIRAIQGSLGLPFARLGTTPVAESESGQQFWLVQNLIRQQLDTAGRLFEHRGIFVFSDTTENVSHVVFSKFDPCDPETPSNLEPSISTDSEGFTIRHRDWRRCGSGVLNTSSSDDRSWPLTSVRLTSRHHFKWHHTSDIVRLYPRLRRSIANDAPLEVVREIVVHVALFALDGVTVELFVMCRDKGDPIENPDIVTNIFAALDASVRRHTRENDAAMRKVSHWTQQMLGRAVIRTDDGHIQNLLAALQLR